MNSEKMKTILDKLEQVFEDPDLKSITYFTNEPKKKRLKVTAVAKNKGTYLVVVGRPCYAERQFMAARKGDDLRNTCWLRYRG